MNQLLKALGTSPLFGSILSIESSIVVVSLENGETLSVKPERNPSILHFGWKGARVSVLDTKPETIILEPDYLVDVTTVAECISGAHSLPLLALLRKFEPRTLNGAAAKGNLANAVVDLVIADSSRTDDDLITTAMSERPLTWAALHQAGEDIEVMVEYVRGLLPSIRERVASWQDANIIVEPHVLSPVLGLQGRFDILLERTGSTELIELKAGSAPNGIRANHAAQVVAYEMLYAASHTKPLTSSSVWYASVDAIRRLDGGHIHGVVAADPLEYLQQQILETRNAIVAHEHGIGRRDFTALKKFTGRSLAASGPAGAFEQAFVSTYQAASAISRTIVQVWTSFLSAETRAVKMDSNGRAQSDVWLASSGEKELSQTVATNLQPDLDASNEESMHVLFRSPQPLTNLALRKGDLVLLHHSFDSSSSGWRVVKGWLTHVGDSELEVSFRNKQFKWQDIISHSWTVEQDTSDLGLRTLTAGLYEFLSLDSHRQNVIVGMEHPMSTEREYQRVEDLDDKQNAIVKKALDANDYCLIQGPPGTGKTSRILRSIVEKLLLNSNERVLVVAYTNRAVDEICSVLQERLPTGSFIRHGSKSGTSAFRDVSTIGLSETQSVTELAESLENVRCIVTTVQSANSGPELYAFGRFSTLVVDEAAQILEPQLLGLIARTRRFIMIGDHAQLPPVVSQSSDQLSVSAKMLSSVGLRNMGTSLFERLFEICTQRGWTNAYARLSAQGRMHADIMNIVSECFYQGELETVQSWQNDSSPTPWSKTIPSRTVFYDVQEPSLEKQRDHEIRQLVRCIELLRSFSTGESEPSIGVISPFRSFNRDISSALASIGIKDIAVDTVERFQGSQRDIIIYATGVHSKTEFEKVKSEVILENQLVDRKLNVACSRARNQLIIIGDRSVLTSSSPYRQLIDAIRILT